jgi:Disulphide bond corrector protein DsbC
MRACSPPRAWFLLLPVVFVCASAAQTLAPRPTAIQRVTLVASAAPSVAATGGTVTLLLDVTPRPDVHVYAPGARDFVQTRLTLSPQGRLIIGKPGYPKAELVLDPVLNERIPEYTKTFRIAQPVTLGSALKSREDVTISGVLSYQACDDKMCYPPASALVTWTVKVK